MQTIYIASIVAIILLIAVILFFIFRKHKDTNTKFISRRERLSLSPELALTTTYGQAPPTDNYYTYQYYKLPLSY